MHISGSFLFIDMKQSVDVSKEELILLIEQGKPYSTIGDLYGISGNAIRKKAIRLGIELPRRRKINPCEVFAHPGKRKVRFESYSKVNTISDDEFRDVIATSKTWAEISKKLGYRNACLSPNVKDAIRWRMSMLGMDPREFDRVNVMKLTKGEIFEARKNWNSARGAIRKCARDLYLKHNPNPKCAICGYSTYVDIAHIKSVSSFPDSALISEINSLSNLIALCPNHHWEYDNGILDITLRS